MEPSLKREMTVCTICGKEYKYVTQQKECEIRHANKKQYFCPFPGCGKSLMIMGTLSAHKKIHEERKYECNMCGKKFTQGTHLKTHVKGVMQGKEFMIVRNVSRSLNI